MWLLLRGERVAAGLLGRRLSLGVWGAGAEVFRGDVKESAGQLHGGGLCFAGCHEPLTFQLHPSSLGSGGFLC